MKSHLSILISGFDKTQSQMENSCLESVGAHKGQLCKVGLVTFTFVLIQASVMGHLGCDRWWQMV